LTSALLAETTLRLRQSYLQQMNHLDILNRAAQALASTIEYHQVINLACSLVQESIQTDSYYLGLLQNDKLRLELIYDLGEYFPPTEVALEDTLVAHVIRRAQPLLINDMEAERWNYKRCVHYVGQPRMSQSWLGVPMVVGGAVIGVIVVSSYHKNAFSLQDVWLLENLARQTAMAIDNARHHQQVEQRSQLDSLTQVLNHNAFLETLQRALAQVRGTGSPLSLIMLDVDYFKEYNDAFGHLLGDHVLKLIIETIRQHIKCTDWVGRWGGEEFVIALPNATGAQAYQVAQRIRETLRQAHFIDRWGNPVKPPTVSQGIAVFPDEADEVFALIDLADQRLYVAKSRGRDQVEPGADFWAHQAESSDKLLSVEQGSHPLPDFNPER
ncbi:MAG: sensor domain-containing diguanylate cyclase, partial [Thermanaerothrix sp.]|nr:sensor domain-containing diguanylate cyclase [Thermanaerothrix sp.]